MQKKCSTRSCSNNAISKCLCSQTTVFLCEFHQVSHFSKQSNHKLILLYEQADPAYKDSILKKLCNIFQHLRMLQQDASIQTRTIIQEIIHKSNMFLERVHAEQVKFLYMIELLSSKNLLDSEEYNALKEYNLEESFCDSSIISEVLSLTNRIYSSPALKKRELTIEDDCKVLFFSPRDQNGAMFKLDLATFQLSKVFQTVAKFGSVAYCCRIGYNRFFYYGGDIRRNVNNSYILDFDQMKCTELELFLPDSRCGGCIYKSGCVFVFGGKLNDERVSKDAIKIELESHKLTRIEPLLVPSEKVTCSLIKEKILLIGYSFGDLMVYDDNSNLFHLLYNFGQDTDKILCDKWVVISNRPKFYEITEFGIKVLPLNGVWDGSWLLSNCMFRNSENIYFVMNKKIWRLSLKNNRLDSWNWGN